MKKLLLLLGMFLVVTGSALAQKPALYVSLHTEDSHSKKIIFMDGSPFKGDRNQLLSYEKTKLPQPSDNTLTILYQDEEPGTVCRMMNPHTIFIKDKNGFWEETVTVFNALPDIRKTPLGIQVTFTENDGSLQKGNFLLEEKVLTSYPSQSQWTLEELSSKQ